MNKAEKDMAEEYLAQVRRAMWGMDSTVRDGIISELRGHLEDSLADAKSKEAREQVFADMEEPVKMARRYKAIYGYGKTFNTLLILDCLVMAFLSVPLLYSLEWEFLASLFFAFAVAEVGLVGYLGGNKVGLYAGLSTAVTRIVLFMLIYIINSDIYVQRTEDVAAFIFVSLVLVIVGYGMGHAKETWPGDDE